MCGIAGFLKFKNSKVLGSPQEERRVLEAMARALIHRGPDDEGFYEEGPVHLGMRRLKIIDLEGGAQPVFNEDKSLAVVLNGEIYNYVELRRDLEQRGHRFYTHSDTEVLVHLYEQEGEAFPSKLRGMFAFALWDSKKSRLILGRDPFGIKPLYWGEFNGQLMFASEIKALRHHPFFKRETLPSAVDDYLSLMYVPGPQTVYKNLWKLEPGHLLICGADGGRRKVEYWTGLPPQKPSPVSLRDCLSRLESKISDCVKIALRSDVPLGVFLSSGLDSSIVSYFSKQHKADLQTFTVYFRDESYSERKEAAAVARALGTRHTEILMETPADVPAFAETVLGAFDEPFGDTSALPSYLLCQAARRHVTVSLSGDGGDELFAGYPTFIATRFFRMYGKMPSWLRKDLMPALTGMLPTSFNRVSLDYKLKRFFGQAGYHDDWREIHFAWRGAFSWSERREMYDPEFYRTVESRRPFESVLGLFDRVKDASLLDQLLYADRMTYLADEFLVKMDRMSMAHSLEVRPPFLDPELAGEAWRVPAKFKIRGLSTKWILRRLMQDKLPPEVLKLPKKGFTPPLAHWLQEPGFQDFMRSALGDPTVRNSRILSASYAERLLSEHAQRRADHSRRLWVLLGLALFLKRNAVQAAQPV